MAFPIGPSRRYADAYPHTFKEGRSSFKPSYLMDATRFKAIHYAVAVGLFFLFFFIAVSAPPKNFPAHSIITVREGAGLLEVSNSLKAQGVIRSAGWFRTVVIAVGGENKLQ